MNIYFIYNTFYILCSYNQSAKENKMLSNSEGRENTFTGLYCLETNPCMSGSVQDSPMLFKGLLYFLRILALKKDSEMSLLPAKYVEGH